MSSTDLGRTETEMRIRRKPRSRPFSEMGKGTMFLCQSVLGLIIMGMWQWMSGTLVDNFFISNPVDVSFRLWKDFTTGMIWIHLWVTFYETVAGFVLGSLIGIFLGIWLGVAHFMSRLLNPFLFGFYAMPKIALAPLFVLWFGLGMESKIALSTVIVFFLVFFNTYTGVRDVDPDMIDAVRLMKATRAQILTLVIVPSAMGWIFAGLKISVPYALIGA
ncbi:MAG: ABC transporter permease, partial [bacterium]